ncbi:MAG: radical SAM protein [Kiritimatiellae bacterium]|nr:radical SAM protein [Kiritimatiellia bacterium]
MTNKPLRVLAWEVTRRCPMACQHCRGASRDCCYTDELSTSEALRVMDSLAAAQASSGRLPLIIFTGGEPMYRADLDTLVRYATSRGFPAVLAPCGRFADEQRLTILKEAGIRALSLSVDGPDAATHDAFRGVPGAFRMACDAMTAAKAVGLPFQVNHTLTRTGLGNLRAMRDFALRQGASRLDVFFLVPVGRGEALSAQCLTDSETETALQEILALDDEGILPIHVTCEPRILTLTEARSIPPKSPCNGCMAGAGFLFLSHTGQLQPCGFFDLSLGNVRTFDCDLPKTLAASTHYAALNGGRMCLARAAYQHRH